MTKSIENAVRYNYKLRPEGELIEAKSKAPSDKERFDWELCQRLLLKVSEHYIRALNAGGARQYWEELYYLNRTFKDTKSTIEFVSKYLSEAQR